MSDTASLKSENAMITEDDVLAFLRDNPDFLNANLEALLPEKKRPRRGEVADFQGYMIERLRADKSKAVETTREIIENSRANMNTQQRIYAAVLRLLEARSFNDFIHTLTMDLSSLLNVDITSLVVESDGADIPHIQMQGIRMIPAGTVDGWMGDKLAILESHIGGHEAIYGGGATLVRSQILLRLSIAEEAPAAILAFGSRDPEMFGDGQATDQVLFLAGVIERAMRVWLSVPV
ncbi:MAG: DUF484 family protein [Alphaproteobacteria bacterium]|nr:DUF484 family protein [Alphaproteobacteria bacterium]MCB1651905.1 DUF484 family protein [Alphaproteobacteria bacterium]